MYKIFLDKNKIFECDIQIEGADLNESEVRLLLESEDFAVTFKGFINPNGTVQIPIHKMKGILKENYTGKISLEVIAEDTVFTPWTSEYKTDLSKKVQVKIDESFTAEDPKPKISFNLLEKEEKAVLPKVNVSKNLNELQAIIKKNGVKYNDLAKNPIVFNKLIEKYYKVKKINDTSKRKEIKKQLFDIIIS